MHHHVDAVVADAEQLVGLDDLEPLVHERAGVDGDLGAHRPGRVGQGVGRRHRLQLGPAPAPEGAAAGGQYHRHHPAGVVVGPQALVDGAVLGVHWDDLGPRSGPGPLHHRASRHQRLLVGQPEPLARLQGGQGDRQPGEADHPVDHRVGQPGRRGHGPVAGHQLGSGREPSGQGRGQIGVGDRHRVGAELQGLLGQPVHRAGRPQRGHPVSLRPGPHDVERLGPDGAGGPEHGHRDGHRTSRSAQLTRADPDPGAPEARDRTGGLR